MAYTIERGVAADAARLREIERASGARFRAIGMDAIADSDPTDAKTFHERAGLGQLLLARAANLEIAGFLIWSLKDGMAYIEEVSVHPDHAGHRLAAQLIDSLAEDARGRMPAVTLATFRDVPWNGPYYAKLGFAEWPYAEAGPGHHETWRDQADDGLDMSKRVFMIRRL